MLLHGFQSATAVTLRAVVGAFAGLRRDGRLHARVSRMRWLWIPLLVVFSAIANGQTHYEIRITQPEHHIADIQMQFTATSAGDLALRLPAWRSGKYQILDLANGVRFLKVVDAQGQVLPVAKTDGHTWQVTVKQAGPLTVSYQIYANQLDSRVRHIDETHAYINASGYLLYTDALRLQPVRVQLHVPSAWRSVSGMSQGDNPHQFVAANYDVLADSPIESGIHQAYKFEVSGRQYELVIWGQGNYHGETMAKDLATLVQQADFIWPQPRPYQRYVFIVHATDQARGATEHLNSTVIQKQRFSFASRTGYLEFLSTASHELVHTWNVKAYRPSELVPYNYAAPNYSRLLWVSEGSTSYFQNILLLKGGLMTPKEYYQDLAKRIVRFGQLPGAQVQSVAESSFDSWISLAGDHADNFSVNIYSEGYMASWLLDHDMLSASALKAGYRHLHQALYTEFGKTTAFTADDMQRIAKALTGRDFAAWWQQHIEAPLRMDATILLQSAGLQLKMPNKQKASTGISSQFKDGVEWVNKVRRDSAAWKAGLTSDDQIIAVNALQLKAPLKERLTDFKPGDKISLSFFRQGRLQQTELELAAEPDGDVQIVPVANPTKAQRQFHQAWLGIPLPDAVDKTSKSLP